MSLTILVGDYQHACDEISPLQLFTVHMWISHKCEIGKGGYFSHKSEIGKGRNILNIFKALKYFCINHGEQGVIFNLKSSQMSWVAVSASFEYLCYGSTATINIYLTHFPLSARFQRRSHRFLISDMHVQNKKYGDFVSISSLSGNCGAQKIIKNFAVLVCGHVYIIWSY